MRDAATAGALAAACGPDRVRPAVPADAVNGVLPRYVVRPADAAALCAAVETTARLGLAVLPRGAGTKLDWANRPRRLDVMVDVGDLAAIVDHAPADLVVTVQAGLGLAELQAALASSGQCLGLDDPVGGSTIGGLVATALSGPRRVHYGAVRDLLIGVTVVRPDGALAHGGGRVVKNVAGYDLCKLYAGSFGTLGIITEAVFRLHPLPEAAAFVHVSYPDPGAAMAGLRAAVSSRLAPAAVEVECPVPAGPAAVTVLLEGSARGVPGRVSRLSALLGPGASEVQRPGGWGHLPGPSTIRMTSQLEAVPGLIAAAATAAADAGVEARVRGSAAAGILHVGFGGDLPPDTAAAYLAALRAACRRAGGFATLVRAPENVRDAVDAWGPVPGLSIMRAVKATFDPDGRFSPGRFVGGI
jgi:glycolate oxidase FAD binding subunit